MQMTTFRPARRALAALVVLASAFAVLASARPAPGDIVSPVIMLGPTTIAGGVASVSGTVTTPWASSAQLTVNGQPLEVRAAGQFAGTVNLGGQSTLSLAAGNPATGEVSTINVPLTTNLVGPGGLVPPQVLSGLEQAAVEITKPVGGFVSVGDEPIVIGGSVGDPDQLAGLTVNGVDALSTLSPNGTFTVPIPGTSKDVGVVLTDKQGVSLETSNPLSRSTYVSAANAVGARITSVRYFAKKVRTTRRVRVIVTVKDRRGMRIRGAKVTVKSVRAGRVAGRPRVKRSTKQGQAGFVLRLRSKAFGKRLVLVATARTPTAKAAKRTSIRLPRRGGR
jgi:hypothetical protein